MKQHNQFALLDDARESLRQRVALIRMASHSIKLQYYMWRDDASGLTLLNECKLASERGVKVYLLLDDFTSKPTEQLLRDLSQHPNFRVKLFNPLVHRKLRWLNYFTDFRRVNRRMHNKAFIVDDCYAIVGGRNISDEYFGTHAGQLFSDLDVLVKGDCVSAIAEDWSNYWQCDLAVSIDNISGRSRTEAFIARWQQFSKQAHAEQLNEYVFGGLADEDLDLSRLTWHSAEAQWISDDPYKASMSRKPSRLVVQQMVKVLSRAKQQVRMVSPYFVPTQNGVQQIEAMLEQGVQFQVLTNSLAATDVPAVHAGYQRRRRRLLTAGVKLYEIRRTEESPQNRVLPYFRRSATSLHAKTVTVDERSVFVGSFNFDPRSAQINTEAGLIIESPSLAKRIIEIFDHELPLRAYQVRLNRFYKLYWVDRSHVPVKRIYREPDAGWRRRFVVWLTARLPVDHLL